ncbi:DUF1599 domain-containing protein [Candidatus Poribacteria bacterium]|nr:DUF1599 domain-containing protein [Candidatus Poribacteria bacterium]
MESNTSAQYDEVVKICKEIFLKKTQDYGESWRVLRLPSITDQIFIKARRIRRLEELQGRHKISEGVEVEYSGIVNYCVMALIKLSSVDISEQNIYNNSAWLKSPDFSSNEKSIGELSKQYDAVIAKTKDLMERKNYDYGEAWRDMRLSSITDQILVKTLRIKQIEEHEGQVLVSEGLEAEYNDILNYCVFALIRLKNRHVSENSPPY